MNNSSIKSRLAKLQQKGGSFPDVLRWIAEGRIYDELADTREVCRILEHYAQRP